MQGAPRSGCRGGLVPAAGSHEECNAADGSFSAAVLPLPEELLEEAAALRLAARRLLIGQVAELDTRMLVA